MNILDLPIDILLLIFPYLDVPSFVSFTSSCKPLSDPSLAQYPPYWSHATHSTFRVPNQPVVENDGKRWQNLYKRLRTQSRVFTWGNNEKACLGHSYESLEDHALRTRRAMGGMHVSWPTEMGDTKSLGIIADMQCGGWSTTLLTSKGALYSVGVLDGLQFSQRRPPYRQQIHTGMEKLSYPPGFPHPSDRYDQSTAVKQFSSGRSHVLAVSDSGRIWSWNNIDQAALTVKFLNFDLREGAQSSETGAVKKVVAGWNKSAALITGVGIVLWDVLSRSHDETGIEDAALVLETAIVPDTGFRRVRGRGTFTPRQESAQNEHIGEVINLVCLEHFVLLNTHLGKVFAGKITWTDRQQEVSPLFELPVPAEATFSPSNGEVSQPFATDVQGSFRSFAVFTSTGAVLTGTQDHLQALFSGAASTAARLVRIPALQHTQVISLAFGDYHFHALHAPGYITSYGTESQGCGSLGLGGHGDPEGRLRGLRYAGFGGDGRLVPHAYTTGRRVWFEREKQEWIKFLTSGGSDPEEARDRMRMCSEIAVQGEVSEWVEQEGRAWEERFDPRNDSGASDDVLGHPAVAAGSGEASAFFALSVTAAGWHSGALVLVNDDAAQRISKGCIVQQPATKPQIPCDDDSQSQPTQGNEQEQHDGFITSTLASTLAWANTWARWFLGVPPNQPIAAGIISSASIPAAQANAAGNTTPHPASRVQTRNRARNRPPLPAPNSRPRPPFTFALPQNHGAATTDGDEYVWTHERHSFPRLRLADGREMPGEVPFAEWRYGRPEWNLEFQA